MNQGLGNFESRRTHQDFAPSTQLLRLAGLVLALYSSAPVSGALAQNQAPPPSLATVCSECPTGPIYSDPGHYGGPGLPMDPYGTLPQSASAGDGGIPNSSTPPAAAPPGLMTCVLFEMHGVHPTPGPGSPVAGHDCSGPIDPANGSCPYGTVPVPYVDSDGDASRIRAIPERGQSLSTTKHSSTSTIQTATRSPTSMIAFRSTFPMVAGRTIPN